MLIRTCSIAFLLHFPVKVELVRFVPWSTEAKVVVYITSGSEEEEAE